MSLAPIIEAPAQIQIHIAAVSIALILGPLQLLMPKGSSRHRLMGRVWAGSMALACVSAFLILDRPIAPNIGPFSWLHALALFTLVMLFRAVRAAQTGEVVKHRKIMTALLVFALGLPAAFAIAAPGRILHKALFETAADARPPR